MVVGESQPPIECRPSADVRDASVRLGGTRGEVECAGAASGADHPRPFHGFARVFASLPCAGRSALRSQFAGSECMRVVQRGFFREEAARTAPPSSVSLTSLVKNRRVRGPAPDIA